MTTGKDIRLARQRAGMTQGELATAVGVSLRTVGNWERGENVPRSRMPVVEAVLSQYLAGPTDEPALSSASDAELVAEIARRFARTGNRSTHAGQDAPESGPETGRTQHSRQDSSQDGGETSGRTPMMPDDYPHFDPDERTETIAHLNARRDLEGPPLPELFAADTGPERTRDKKRQQDEDAEGPQ